MARFNTRITVEIALTLALSTVLGTLTLWKMPQGGGVSLVMLPILVLAIRRGALVGITAGTLYGILDSMIDPFIVHWAQYLLDYPLAFGAVGLAGVSSALWHKSDRGKSAGLTFAAVVLPAFALGGFGRYLMHWASGFIFFGEYAPEGQNVIVYSAVYNLYVLVAAAASFAVAVVVLPALERAGLGGSRD